MKHMKKVFCLFMAIAMTVSMLVGCGSSGQLADDEVQIGPFTVKVFGLDVDLCCIWSDVEVQ